ncbi:hypothetical protein H0E87_001633, partial [Populus deltoides]
MIDVRRLDRHKRELVVKKALATNAQDNYKLLSAIKERLDRVGIEVPKVEVRFENLNISAKVQTGSRALPTLINVARDLGEGLLTKLGLFRATRFPLTILNDISGVVKPGRMTLLLGPPGSGKSTLLLALAGKLAKNLKKSGNITYNGQKFDDFYVQRTSAYISQTDNHIAELTVRETLDFAACWQGASEGFGGYMEDLVRLEKERNVRPNPEVDAFMKASSVGGKKHSISTDYVLKVLGLDVCSETVVGNDMLRGVSGGQRKRVAFVGFVTCTLFLRTRLHPTDEMNGNLYLSCLFFGLKSSFGNNTVGNNILYQHSLPSSDYWYWIGVGVLLLYALLFNIIVTWALTYLNPLTKARTVAPADVTQENSDGNDARAQEFELNRSSLNEGSKNKGMILPFQPLTMTFHNVNYFVDMPKEMSKQGITEKKLQLLSNVSGVFSPGVLTALVGSSGAGKTTLMDVLAGRKTGGYIEGDIKISGYPKEQRTFARISGYVEQNDIHSPQLTIEESLLFSSSLRLPKEVSKEQRVEFVEEVMRLVELDTLRQALVGLPGSSGLSTEQRKRLTIAVELVANPSIIFMDEPTSGLDARAAAIVMRTVRNTVDTGRTVVCTIHQPSIDIFEAFDELLLMKRGGRVIYGGKLGVHS